MSATDVPGSGVPLLAGAGGAVGAGALLLLGDGLVLHLVGYALACAVAFVLVALYRRHALRRLAAAGIGQTRGRHRLTVMLLVAGLLVGGVHAWIVAVDLARQAAN